MKERKFFLGNVSDSAIRAARIESPPHGSIRYECGGCILLIISRLVGGVDLCQSVEEAAKNNPTAGNRVRTYLQCISIIGAGSLRYVDYRELKTGYKYLIHADGRGEEPRCVSMCISHNDDVAVSDLNSTYFHSLPGIRDLLADSAGNPVVFEYIHDSAASLNSSQIRYQDINISLLSLSAGYYLAGDKPMLRRRDVVSNSFDTRR